MVTERSTWLKRAKKEAEYLAQNQLLIPNVAFSTENYFKIAEKTGLIFLIFSQKTDKLVYVSPKYEEIWGENPKYLYKHSDSWIFQVHPEDYHLASHTIATKLRSSYEFEEEYRIVNGKRTTPVRVSAFPVYCNARCITYYFALFEDRTPYYQLAANYQQNIDRFAYFFQQAPNSLAITDQFGKFSDVNNTFCRLTGYSHRELSRLGWHDLIKSDRQRHYFRLTQAIVAGKHSTDSTKTLVTKDGHEIEVGIKITLGQEIDGQTFFNNQITDLRERRFIESSLIADRSHDRHTKLPHRVSFIGELEREIREQKVNSHNSFMVLIVKIDKLDQIRIREQTYYLAIKEIISRIEAQINGRDTLASLGSEHFGLILRDTDSLSLAVEIAGNIIKALKKSLIIDDKQLFFNSCVAVIEAKHHTSGTQILNDGSLTLEAIAVQNQAPIKVFDRSIRQEALYRLELASALPAAIENDEFEVYYQPIVSLKTGELYGFEALVRWQRGDTVISPLKFIPICEETGTIVPLGLKLMETACRQTRTWQQRYEHHQKIKISVNLSAKQFYHESLVDDIRQVLSTTGLHGRHLKLEITESLFIDNMDSVISMLNRLTELDIQLSIDDFGTGYSSLSYLQTLPAHTLKLDRAFVTDVVADKDKAIASAIVTLGHMVGMNIIAEGIETETQLDILRSLGCEYGQGYYFAKPLPEAEVEEYLASYYAVAQKIS